MHSHHYSRRPISTRHFPAHYWDGEYVDQATMVTDGFDEFWVRGDCRGDTLYVFHGIHLIDSGADDHAEAVEWARRQFEPSRKPVQL